VSGDERQATLARIYARAIFELAEEKGEGEALLEELAAVAQVASREPAFSDFLGSPLVDREDRRASLEEIFRGQASDLLVDTLQVLNRKGRLALLPGIVRAYRGELRERRGLVDVRVATAAPLPAPLRERLAAVLVRLTGGRRPEIEEKVEPALVGGMVVEVEGRKLDASLAKRLRELSAALAERATQEILRRRAAPLAGAAEGGGAS
jgi:F-type H+-transporting ATPase subunit delta